MAAFKKSWKHILPFATLRYGALVLILEFSIFYITHIIFFRYSYPVGFPSVYFFIHSFTYNVFEHFFPWPFQMSLETPVMISLPLIHLIQLSCLSSIIFYITDYSLKNFCHTSLILTLRIVLFSGFLRHLISITLISFVCLFIIVHVSASRTNILRRDYY